MQHLLKVDKVDILMVKRIFIQHNFVLSEFLRYSCIPFNEYPP